MRKSLRVTWAAFVACVSAASSQLVVANALLLMFVSFVPFPTSVLGGALRGPATEARAAAVFYNGTFVVIAVFFNVLWHMAVRQRLLRPGSREAAARITRSYALGPPSYLAATLASTRSAELGLAINGALVLMYWFTPRAPLTAVEP